MAVFIKQLLFLFSLAFPLFSIGHTIYAPNDIPLLDNRFRIDPKAEQVTFIFNHSEGAQRVVLVQPDGSKLFEHKHPDTVAWTSSKTQNIVTIQQPMAGPWQAVAKLDGDNRIKIMSKVRLEVSRLPLKLYEQEYITTHATLYDDKELLTNSAYLADAKLSISLIGEEDKRVSLYHDDGKRYDELAFDGKLTTRLYVNLDPGRYLLSIRTKNEVFIRNVNKDAVVFPLPITYRIADLEMGMDKAKFTFIIDNEEIDPNTVVIEGFIKDPVNKVLEQITLNNIDGTAKKRLVHTSQPLPYDVYSFSGKAYATTHDGREIELQLTRSFFQLIEPIVIPEVELSGALATSEAAMTDQNSEEVVESSLFSNIWVIVAISVVLLLIIAAVVFFLLKRKKKKQQADETPADELSLDELQPSTIDMEDDK